MKAKEETAIYVQTTLYCDIGGVLQSGIQDVLQVKLPRPKPESMEAEILHKHLELVRDSALTTLNFYTYNSRGSDDVIPQMKCACREKPKWENCQPRRQLLRKMQLSRPARLNSEDKHVSEAILPLH